MAAAANSERLCLWNGPNPAQVFGKEMPVCREALAVMFHFMDTDGSNTIERSPRRAHAPFMLTLADALSAHPSEHAGPSMRKVPSAGGTMGGSSTHLTRMCLLPALGMSGKSSFHSARSLRRRAATLPSGSARGGR